MFLAAIATLPAAKFAGAKLAYDKLQCQTDQFSVTNPGNNAPPVICGTNSGEHSMLPKNISVTLVTIIFCSVCRCFGNVQ